MANKEGAPSELPTEAPQPNWKDAVQACEKDSW